MPSVEFLEELGKLTPADLTAALTRYVCEVFPTRSAEAARAIADALYGAVPTARDGEERPQLLRVRDFMELIGDPPRSIVDGFIPAQKLVVLSGLPKQGKSFVALEFLECISTARALMGRFPIEMPGPVAYFGLEDGGHEIKSRLTQRGITDLDNFYVCWTSFDIAAPGGMATFEGLIAQMDAPPHLVIIDTAREALRSIRDWNDASQVGDAISPLRRWAQANCTIILVTHNNKNAFAEGVNKISGSGALVSSADCYMILGNKKALENGNLRWNWEMGGRGLRQTTHALEMDTHSLHFRVLSDDEVKTSQAQTAAEARDETKPQIAAYLGEHSPATIAALVEALDLSPDFVSKVVKEMVSAGVVAKAAQRQSGKQVGRPRETYELTKRGLELIDFAHCPTQYPQTINYYPENASGDGVSTAGELDFGDWSDADSDPDPDADADA